MKQDESSDKTRNIETIPKGSRLQRDGPQKTKQDESSDKTRRRLVDTHINTGCGRIQLVFGEGRHGGTRVIRRW